MLKKIRFFRNYLSAAAVTVVASAILLYFLGIYLSGTLSGQLKWHMLPSVRFGPPEYIKSYGNDALYTQSSDGGWDGQMYFYAASDLFDNHQTDKSMDAPAYRYQRIGLPLAAAAAAVALTGSHFVSGESYFFTNLTIVLIAVFSLATFSRKHGKSPWLALCWSCFLSTILCLLNGMPDVAADAFFILAILAYLSDRPIAYFFSMSMACLSRESFVLPATILFGSEAAAQLLRYCPQNKFFNFCRGYCSWPGISKAAWHLAPILIFIAWQTYLKIHFGVFPGQQAGAVIDTVPFRALLTNFLGAITHNHRVMSGERSFDEARMLIIFVVLFFLATVSIFRIIKATASSPNGNDKNIRTRSLGLSLASIVVLYAFFGDTVMEHYTGYLKAAGIFLIAIIFDLILLKMTRTSRYVKVLLVCLCIGLSDWYLYYDRLSEPYPHHYKSITHYDDVQVIAGNKMTCLKPFFGDFKLVGVEDVPPADWFRKLYHRPKYQIFEISFTNNGNKDILPVSIAENHPVYISYQWIDKVSGQVNEDGFRSVFQQPLLIGQSRVIPVLVRSQQKAKDDLLRFSAFQDGCGWMYQKPGGDSFSFHKPVDPK